MDDIVVRVMDRAGRPSFEMYYDSPMSGRRIVRSTGVRRSDDMSDRQRLKAYREAEKAAGKWEDQLHNGTYKRPSRIDWAEFRRRYEDEHLASLKRSKDGKSSTVASYSTVLNLVEEILRPKRLRDLTPDRLSYFQSQLRIPDEDGRQRSETTIHSYMKMLRAALGWAVDVGMLKDVPKIKMPTRAHSSHKRARKMKGRPVTTEEFERMLSKLPDALFLAGEAKGGKPSRRQPIKAAKRAPVVASWERLLNGLWLSGLRLGEALELSWDDETKLLVDFTGRRPMFRMRPELQKNHDDAPLPMTPDFAAFLERTPPEYRTGPVFPLLGLRSGQLLADPQPDWVSRILSRVGAHARVVVNTSESGKVKHASAHDLRRSFGDRWARRVMPAVLQQLMRHEDIQTTMRYYVDLNAEETADAVWAAAAASGDISGDIGRLGANPPRSKKAATR